MTSYPTSSDQYGSVSMSAQGDLASAYHSDTERQPLLHSGDKGLDEPGSSKVQKVVQRTGIALAFFGLFGLIVLVVLLVPTTGYNVYLSIKTACELFQLEYERTGDWALFSHEAILYSVYFVGSAVLSLAVLGVLLGLAIQTCCSARPYYLDVQYEFEHRRRWATSGLFCSLVLLHLGWTVYGLVLLFGLKLDTHLLPPTLDDATKLSVALMAYSYVLALIGNVILLCASVFISLSPKNEASGQPGALARQGDYDIYSVVSVEVL